MYKKLIKTTFLKRILHFILIKSWTRPLLKVKLKSKHSRKTKNNFTGKQVFVPLIETQHYQFIQILTIAKALQLRGADVKVLLCDQSLDGCEIKSVRNKSVINPCWECKFNKSNLFETFNLNKISYSDILDVDDELLITKMKHFFSSEPDRKVTYRSLDLTKCVEESILRYFYGGEANTLDEHSEVRSDHIATAIKNAMTAYAIDEKWKPDAVLCNMSAYSSWFPYYEYFGERMKLISLSPFKPTAIMYNFNDVILNRTRFLTYYKSRSSMTLDSTERKELDKYFENRFAGVDWLFVKDGFYDGSTENLKIAELNIDPEKRNIFLFSNLYWDTGLTDKAALFEDLVSWVLNTIELVKNEKDIQLYIKTHPAETYGTEKSEKSIKNIIEQEYPDGIPNVTIIDPTYQIKPYSLFPYIDAAVLFQGTLGLELLKCGIPVISCATASYNGMGFVHEPKSLNEYRELILSAENLEYDEELLYVFLYFFFMKLVSFPYEQSAKTWGTNIYHPINIKSEKDLEVGESKSLDHLCNLILGDNTVSPENWKS